mgnify:CR=1 FL=1
MERRWRLVPRAIGHQRAFVVKSASHEIELAPGVVCLAVFPVSICPLTPAVVRVLPTFEASPAYKPQRLHSFSARPYARPMSDALTLLIGVTAVAAVAGLSPVVITSRGASNEGSPDPLRFRPDLSAPVAAGEAKPVLWKLLTLS